MRIDLIQAESKKTYDGCEHLVKLYNSQQSFGIFLRLQWNATLQDAFSEVHINQINQGSYQVVRRPMH